ncbi:hypothetical protein BDZ89DRAFT_1085220, partial [Hymenopellis radicata]
MIQKPPVAHSPENALLRQLLHEEAVVPLERADTNCHLQELFALGPMLQTVPSDVPICNERLAQLLAEAFAEPSESSNVQRAILNPDESVTESEASDGEDCDKFDSLLRLLSVPEAGRTKQWAFERLALFSKLETLMAKERVDDVWADNTLAQLQVEQEKLRIKVMAGRSAA